jgi:protein-tyrosine phosphatase
MTKRNDTVFTDVHCHLLPGVDDGAADVEQMADLLSIAWEDGIRRIFFTPHVRRPWLDRAWSEVEAVFADTKAWCAEYCPGLEVFLGSEFAYSGTILREEPEKIHDMNGSGFLLVEFKPFDSYERIVSGCQQVMMAGYDVILAHIERYTCMLEDVERARRIAELGVRIQVNCEDIVRPVNFRLKMFVKKLLQMRLADLAGTDAHGAKRRRPEMSRAYSIVTRYTDKDYADRLFWKNADVLCTPYS